MFLVFKKVFYSLFFFLISCIWGGGTSDPAPVGNLGGDPPPIERRIPKRPDPIKQAECNKKSRSNTCNDNEDCKDICDDVFRSRADKKDCYRLPIGIVEEFEKLLEFAEDGDVEDISPEILECMLDIDEREFAKAIKKMSRTEAREFLVAIADDGYLAEVLEDEDDEFNILKQVLNKATGSNALLEHLTKEIDDGKSFFWFAAAGNEQAFEYLDDYVSEVCDGSPQNVCSSGDNIEAYCRALTSKKDAFTNKRDLEDFLDEADLFAEEYEDDVEEEDEQDKGYLYEIEDNHDEEDYNGDFRKWCTQEIIAQAPAPPPPPPPPPTPTPCPDDGTEPDSSNKIASITLNSGGEYIIDPYFCQDNGNKYSKQGSSNPSDQGIVLKLGPAGSGNGGEIFILKSVIGTYDSTDSDKQYYLYVDDDRYALNSHFVKEYDHGDCGDPDQDWTDEDVYLWRGFFAGTSPLTGSGTHNFYLASEEDGDCTYYTPGD